MTEKSYFYSHGAGGDAVYSPYNRVEFNDYFQSRFVGNETGLFVIPDYLESLKVESGGTLVSSVSVRPGSAVINGIIYESDTGVSINIPRTTTYGRIDYIVLRVDYHAQTVRVNRLQGDEMGTITAPSLTQTAGVLWEELLAWVYVDPATDFVALSDIYDKRQFLVTSGVLSKYDKGNLVKNSEFMSFSGLGTATRSPEHWSWGNAGTLAVTAAISPMTRGRAITLSSTTLTQRMKVSPGTKTFSIKLLFQEVTGNLSITLQGVRSNGLSTVKYMQQYFRSGNLTAVNGGIAIGYCTETITFDEDDIEYLQLNIANSGGNTYIGQALVSGGYHTGPVRPINETIVFQSAVSDASWTTTAKSSGTTTISLVASFSSIILPGTKAVIAKLRGRDSASLATNATYMQILGYSVSYPVVYDTLYTGGMVNDKFTEKQCVIPVNQSLFDAATGTPTFRVTVAASGALTFDATIQILGIVI